METATSQELGCELYNSCKRFVDAFWENNKKLKQKFGNLVKTNADVNFKEHLVGYMWAIFDLLNADVEKYEKSKQYLFGAYIKDHGFVGKEADEEMKYLEGRIDLYKNLFRREGKINYNFQLVAFKMAENITENAVAFLFAEQLQMHLQQIVLAWGDFLQKVKISDR